MGTNQDVNYLMHRHHQIVLISFSPKIAKVNCTCYGAIGERVTGTEQRGSQIVPPLTSSLGCYINYEIGVDTCTFVALCAIPS